MTGLQRLTADQRLRLETEVAIVEAAIAELDTFNCADVDPTFRMLIGLSATQMRLGLSSISGILALQDRIQRG